MEDPTWQGAFNFMDGAGQQTEYEYDENGNLTKDLNKNILHITYNFLNLPKEIMFMDGSYIHYTYDAAGTLLRKGYYVGEELELLDEEPIEIPDIEYTEEESINPMAQLMSNDEPIEEDLEPIEEEIPYTDVTDYCGNCVYENGTLKMILIEDGYVTFDSNNQPVYHFYLQDHLGNNRVVANASGQAEQVNHYYPYGGLMAESTGGDVQRYKYNGKELDRMLGLDWYGYGARHYDGALTMWGTMDPLCEKNPDVTPYHYCHNNPFNRVDPDGKDDYYSTTGQFLFRDEKETDRIIIRDTFMESLSKMTSAPWLKFDTPIENMVLSAEAYSNIFTNILSENGFNITKLKNGSVSIVKLEYNIDNDGIAYKGEDFYNHDAVIPSGDADIARSKPTMNGYEVTAYIHPLGSDERAYLSTVSNVVSVIGVHEFEGHQLRRLGEDQHWRILELQKNHKSWDKITPKLKNLYIDFMKKGLYHYNK